MRDLLNECLDMLTLNNCQLNDVAETGEIYVLLDLDVIGKVQVRSLIDL